MRNSGWLLVVALILGIGAVALVLMNEERASEDHGADEQSTARERSEELEGTREPLEGDQRKSKTPAQPGKTVKPVDQKDERPEVPTELKGRLTLIVRSRTEQQLLQGGSYECSAAKWDKPWPQATGEIEKAEPLEIAVPLDVEIRVRVETAGFVPETKSVRLTPQAPSQQLHFFLVHAAPFSGVELRVFLPNGKPAARLEVVAMIQKGDAFQQLWHRRKTNPDGIYRLPELEAGKYRIECQTIDDEGATDANVPFDYELQVTGTDLHLKQHVCKQGGRIRLTLQQNGAVAGKNTRVDLYHFGPEPTLIACRWAALKDGKRNPDVPLSKNGLAVSAPALLDRAVAPGNYEIRVAGSDGTSIRQPISVQAGTVTPVLVELR